MTTSKTVNRSPTKDKPDITKSEKVEEKKLERVPADVAEVNPKPVNKLQPSHPPPVLSQDNQTLNPKTDQTPYPTVEKSMVSSKASEKETNNIQPDTGQKDVVITENESEPDVVIEDGLNVYNPLAKKKKINEKLPKLVDDDSDLATKINFTMKVKTLSIEDRVRLARQSSRTKKQQQGQAKRFSPTRNCSSPAE